ncbi:retrovirus-related pol polyprotein from transposon TNT 1-94 [Tanacetum coccineum]|uniref:Retrovirus-related pol polyprotein from transposon TNT 1-94 n=1 Tax=Tanacetum coccineum TaxID=301880 RepID=A0ABQ5C3S9_9ASTR
MKVKESLNVTFNESPPPTKLSPLVDDDVGEEEAIKKNTKVVNNNNEEDESIEVDKIINIKESKNHPLNQAIRNLNQRTLRSQSQNHSNFFCFISTIEPKDVKEALKDKSWVVAMEEELNQFVANDVWEFVPLPMSQSVIVTKWVFRNKLNENGIVSRNKVRLVAQGYNQQEGIDYDKTYTLVARLESIRILLAIACASDFKLYQMDVKSAFLNGFINKEVYVAQPLGFIDFQKLNYVYKLKKDLYGLKQAPKAWYDRLKAFLIKHEYSMGMVDNTLFTKKSKSHLIIFEMSMMGELNFFLGLQIKQMEDGIFFNQSKYIKEMLKKFGLEDSKPTKTPMSTEIKLTKDDEAYSVDNSKYRGTKMLSEYQQYYKKTRAYALKFYNDPNMSDELRDIYRTLESRYVHVERTIDPSFYNDLSDDSVAKFTTIGSDCLLSLDEQICPRLIYQIYNTRRLERNSTNYFSIQFVINNHHFNLSIAQFAELTYLPNQGICIYSDAWGLDELEKTLEQIEPYNLRLPAIDDI